MEFGQGNCCLAGAQLVSCEAESQSENLCFLQQTTLAHAFEMVGDEFTSLACSLVIALCLVATNGVSAAVSGSVGAVAQEASPAEVSKRELVSTLGDRDRAAWTWNMLSKQGQISHDEQ